MTIVDFLRARIAEDEADASSPSNRTWSTRWLAECETKRQIVDACDLDTENVYESRRDILQYLASPYSSHPEYEQEWDL